MLRPFGFIACCCVLLGVVAQSFSPNIVGPTMLEIVASVCTTNANTDVATPKIVSPTLLRVVWSVCT